MWKFIKSRIKGQKGCKDWHVKIEKHNNLYNPKTFFGITFFGITRALELAAQHLGPTPQKLFLNLL